jgi:hypothetical protein
MKRKVNLLLSPCGVSSRTRSKKPKLVSGISSIRHHKSWVSATQIRNYMINDHLVDWLKLYTTNSSRHNKLPHKSFNSFILNKGVQFESEVVKFINNRRIPVVSVSEYITDKSVQETIDLMKKGTPIIHSAPVRNNKNLTKGIIDLLVRSDMLDTIIENSPLNDSNKYISAPKLIGGFHYVVIDIKFSTLPFKSDGIHLCNSGSYPAYKAQTYIYNQAIGEIQGYTPDSAYILGRRWACSNKYKKHNSLSCLDKLGTINYVGMDREYVEKTEKALKWVRDVKQYGNTWSISPPDREELYPNMCIDSGKWNKQKEKIADSLGEITKIWYCGTKDRNKALQQNINSWKDPRCTSSALKINNTRSSVIDAILNINRQNVDKIRPHTIQSNLNGWKDIHNEMFVDFETLMDVFSPMDELPKQKKTNQIFMIGIYYKEGNNFIYKSFTCKELTISEEYRIINEFVTFIRKHNNPKLWYWHAENTIWKSAENRQYDNAIRECDDDKANIISNWNHIDTWVDMAKIFRQEPIVIKGCFKFGLKEIIKAMNSHGLIGTKLESECDSGKEASVKAWLTYSNSSNPSNSPVIKDIEKYNEFDVKSLYDLLTYLRLNHT